jgi:hypothetical protein
MRRSSTEKANELKRRFNRHQQQSAKHGAETETDPAFACSTTFPIVGEKKMGKRHRKIF